MLQQYVSQKRVISKEEIQFNHKAAKMLLTEKKKGVSQNGQTPSIIGICSYYVLDRPVFERCQTLLHPELTPWWSFLLADGARHKKPHSPTHPSPCFSDHWPFSNSRSTTVPWPLAAATWSGVWPRLVLPFTLAPETKNKTKMQLCSVQDLAGKVDGPVSNILNKFNQFQIV